MALVMTRPTKHPTTGVWRVRVTIPAPLRELAAAHFGVRREFIESLQTKDNADAKSRAPHVIARLEAKVQALRTAQKSGPVHLTDAQVSTICGRWLDGQQQFYAHHGGRRVDWGAMIRGLVAALEAPDAAGQAPDTSVVATDVAALLTMAGLAVDADSRQRVAVLFMRTKLGFARDMQRRGTSVSWRPTITPEDFASVPLTPPRKQQEVAPASPATVSFTELLAGFSGDKGWAENDRNRYDRKRTLARLEAFLGHADASRVTKADAVAWKQDMQDRGRAVKTQRNDISEMSAIWDWGIRNAKLPRGSNPWAGVSPPKPARTNSRRAFTDAEARRILIAARGETGALRWLPWLACFSGARVGELAQLRRSDIISAGDFHGYRVHDEGEGNSVKNAASRRTVPLHPALIAEGFLEWLARFGADAPLFPDIPVDAFGRRNAMASRRVSRWMQRTVGIQGNDVAANHSWRHWFIDAARAVEMNAEARDAITGHADSRNESAGYGQGMRAMLPTLAKNMALIPSPV